MDKIVLELEGLNQDVEPPPCHLTMFTSSRLSPLPPPLTPAGAAL